MRTAFDLSPLLRSTIGFDRLGALLDAAARLDEASPSYPPYNIEKLGDDRYVIAMAVAGFSESDLELVSRDRSLVICGRVREKPSGIEYLHRGIATRPFERRFDLAEHIRVDRASLVDGMLRVELVREVPEALRPRTIAIETSGVPRLLDAAE
jgi:molecular chaperone IbpA